MWKIFEIFSSVYRKIKWVFNFVKVYISPIYVELVKIIEEVSATDLKDNEARIAVIQKITDYIQSKGIEISDSILNLSIEVVYQLVKNKKA